MNELLSRVKQVETLDGRFPIYHGADISIEQVDPADLRPIAKYVLRENWKRVHKTRHEIHKISGLDAFNTPALIEYNGHVMSPPIVEGNLIVDGLHRCWDSLHNGRRITVVKVNNVDEHLPPIGMPVDWSEVKVVDEAPQEGWECRELRPNLPDDSKHLRRLYRDYSVLGSSGRRPREGQDG